MPEAIYQKYRPKTWAEVTDQHHIRVTLEHEIERNKIAHAYLFVGPRGVGKTTTARLFAKSVNCENRKKGSAESCNECASCKRINLQQSFDIIEIDAASHTGVDHVRENILNAAEVTAGHGGYRVFIIDEVHMLSTAAFNAMLKMLEEPPKHVIFILATTEIHKVPPTIISRCQRFDFKKISSDAIRERLARIVSNEDIKVDDDVLASIATHSDGSLRDAESTLGQVLSLGLKHITMDEASLIMPRSNIADAATLIGECIKRETGIALKFVNDKVEQGITISVFFDDLTSWLRSLILASVSDQLDLFSRGTLGELQVQLMEQAGQTTLPRLQKILDIFLIRRKTIMDSPIPQLPLELAVIESCLTTDDVLLNLNNDNSKGGNENKTKPPVKIAEDKTVKSEVKLSEQKPIEKLKFTLEEVKNRWQEVLEHVKGLNRSLSYVLANASLVGVKENRLEIGVAYPFHHDRLRESKNRSVMAEATQRVFGLPYIIDPILVQIAENETPKL